MVTEMYSLPAYRGGIDPNPLIFGFFVVFFGMMFADLAYGLVLWAVSLGITKSIVPRGRWETCFSWDSTWESPLPCSGC